MSVLSFIEIYLVHRKQFFWEYFTWSLNWLSVGGHSCTPSSTFYSFFACMGARLYIIIISTCISHLVFELVEHGWTLWHPIFRMLLYFILGEEMIVHYQYTYISPGL